MAVPRIFGTITGPSPIEVPASYLDEDFVAVQSITATGSTAARTLQDRFQQQFNVQDYGALGNGIADDATAFNLAATAAAVSGGEVYIPATASFYKLNTTFTVPQGVGVTFQTKAQIRPGSSMTSLINLTANEDSYIRGSGVLANQGGFATNGINFEPAAPGNNRNIVQDVHIVGFVNNIKNTSADYFAVLNVFSQNATGNTLSSITNGTGSMIDGLKVLGDANGIHYSNGPSEGIIITNSQILTVTPGAYSIKFDNGSGLGCQISNVTVVGAVIFDGSGGAIFDATINMLIVGIVGGSASTVVGMEVIGNCADFHINGLTVTGAPKAGLRISDTASLQPQRIYVDQFVGLLNGTASGSADFIIDASNNIGVANVVVSNSSFESTGGSVKSILEIGPGTISSSYGANNAFFAGVTTVDARALPQSGGIPFVNINALISYSAPLTANNVVIGGGAGVTPSAVTNLTWNSGAGNLENVGAFVAQRTSGDMFIADSLTTNPGFISFQATGNTAQFGTDGSVGGAVTGSVPYATLVGSTSANTQFYTSGIVRLTVNDTLINSNVLITALTTTAVASGSSSQAFIKASSTADLGIYYGTGNPSFSAAKGSLYSRTDASLATDRLWTNSDGGTTWVFATMSG